MIMIGEIPWPPEVADAPVDFNAATTTATG